MPEPFDPERILRALSKRGVLYILIGATAARLQGFPRLTADADIAPSTDPDNLKRLAAALRDLRAHVYTESVPEGLPFSCDAETLASANIWNLTTEAGRLERHLQAQWHPGLRGSVQVGSDVPGLWYRIARREPQGHIALEDCVESSSGPTGCDHPH